MWRTYHKQMGQVNKDWSLFSQNSAITQNIHLANYIQVKLICKLWPIIEVKFTCNLNPVILIRGCWVMGGWTPPASVEEMVKPTTHKSQNNDDKSS